MSILAAYILLQAKEHVKGCGGDSHIAVLRESESSGMVDFRLIQHLTEYLKSADHCTGEMLLKAADFSTSDADASEGISSSVDFLKFMRAEEIKRLQEHRESDRNLFFSLGGPEEKRTTSAYRLKPSKRALRPQKIQIESEEIERSPPAIAPV